MTYEEECLLRAPFDVSAWYYITDVCPNCGEILHEMHPEANLYPHWTGGCVAGDRGKP